MRSVPFLLLVGSLLVPRLVRADEEPSDQAAAARALFDQARGLMDAKDYAHACPKFEESYRLNPGGGTLLNLAMCNELLGKTATAWANFQEGLRLARRDGRADREELALSHIDVLGPKLSKLNIVVPKEVRVPGLAVRRNGVEVRQAAWGDAMPVDPGDQEIEVTAPGKKPIRAMVKVTDGERPSYVVPPLEDASATASTPTAPPPKTPTTGAVTSKPPRSDEPTGKGSWTAQHTLGVALAGVGVVSAGVGTYLALQAKSSDTDSDAHCPSPVRCSAAGLIENRDAVRYADFATGAFIAAGVFAGAGAFFFFTAKSPAAVQVGAAAVPGVAAVRVAGVF